MQTEEEKVHLERKTQEAERLTARLVDESERRAAEADRLKDELLKARIAEKQAKEKLLQFLSRTASPSPSALQQVPHPTHSPTPLVSSSESFLLLNFIFISFCTSLLARMCMVSR